MLPDWLFSSRIERVLREQQARDQELIAWLRSRLELLELQVAELTSPGITARVDAPRRQERQEKERPKTVAEVVLEKKAKEEDPGPMPIWGAD